MRKPKRWQVDLPLPSDKVVKIPLQFCRPTPSKNTLPKGWVYAVEDAEEGVKEELTDLSLYNSADRTLTRAQHQCLRTQQSDPYRRHRRATKYNRGAAYVPFNILNEQGVETPARYVKVHLDVPNPFAEARMSMQGPVYRGEIHAAPVNDTETPTVELTAERIRILGDEYRYRAVVDEAVDKTGDRSLKAEVRRYRGLKVKAGGFPGADSAHRGPAVHSADGSAC
jgi:hypothetical protein